MLRNTIFALVLGLGGAAILIGLGVWQMQRLAWKEGIIAQATGMIAADPVALPASLDPVADRYRAVQVSGRFTGEEAHVLTSTREAGPGFLVVAAFETTAGQRILIDRGYVPETEKTTPRPGHAAEVTGNLAWPDDITSSTPGLQCRPQDLVRARPARDGGASADRSGADRRPHRHRRRGHVATDHDSGLSQQSSSVRGHLVPAGRCLAGDDSPSSLAYQNADSLKASA